MEDTRLGAILIESRIIREEDLERCLEIQTLAGGARPLGRILVDEQLIDEQTLENLLRVQRSRRERRAQSPEIHEDVSGRYLDTAVAMGANELHLSEGRHPLVRVAGHSRVLDSERLAGPEVWQFVREHMGTHMLEEIAEKQSVTQEYHYPGSARGRITAFRHSDGVAVNVRLHPPEVRSLESLGLADAVADTMAAGKGLILLTGESGHGTTEAFAAMLHECARHGKRHILVLDDCIEYPEPENARVCMRRIGVHTSDYETGLRSAMRQDPDAIFLGDASDPQAFYLGLNAAESGKLVVAVVHSATTTSVLKRCLGLFPDYAQTRVRSILASVLQCITAIRLVPSHDRSKFHCATEVLRSDEAVREVVRSGSIENLKLLLRLDGQTLGHPMDTSLLRLLESGAAKFEDVFPYARDKALFLRAVSKKGETVHG